MSDHDENDFPDYEISRDATDTMRIYRPPEDAHEAGEDDTRRMRLPQF